MSKLDERLKANPIRPWMWAVALGVAVILGFGLGLLKAATGH